MVAPEDIRLVWRVVGAFLAGFLFMLLVLPDPAPRAAPAFPDCGELMVPHRCVDV
jgi:hypothetical protein